MVPKNKLQRKNIFENSRLLHYAGLQGNCQKKIRTMTFITAIRFQTWSNRIVELMKKRIQEYDWSSSKFGTELLGEIMNITLVRFAHTRR